MSYVIALSLLELIAWLYGVYSNTVLPYIPSVVAGVGRVFGPCAPSSVLKMIVGTILLWIIQKGFCKFDTSRKTVNEADATEGHEEHTFVGTPITVKQKNDSGYLGFLGEPITPFRRFILRPFSPIQVWSVAIDSPRKLERNPFLNYDTNPNSVISSTPTDIHHHRLQLAATRAKLEGASSSANEPGSVALPTSHEVGMPPVAAAHCAQARRMVARLKAMFWSAGESEVVEQNSISESILSKVKPDMEPLPSNTPQEGELSQDSLGLSKIIREQEEDLDRIDRAIGEIDLLMDEASPTESSPTVFSTSTSTPSPVLNIVPPTPLRITHTHDVPEYPSGVPEFQDTVPITLIVSVQRRPVSKTPVAAKNRTVSVICMPGADDISILIPSQSVVSLQSHASDSPQDIPAKAMIKKLVDITPSVPVEYSRRESRRTHIKDNARLLKMFGPVLNEYRERYHKKEQNSPTAGFSEYLRGCLADEKAAMTSKYMKRFLLENPEADEKAISAFIEKLEKQKKITPKIALHYERFEEKHPYPGVKEWANYYTAAMKAKSKLNPKVDLAITQSCGPVKTVEKKEAHVSKIPTVASSRRHRAPTANVGGTTNKIHSRKETSRRSSLPTLATSSQATRIGGVRRPLKHQPAEAPIGRGRLASTSAPVKSQAKAVSGSHTPKQSFGIPDQKENGILPLSRRIKVGDTKKSITPKVTSITMPPPATSTRPAGRSPLSSKLAAGKENSKSSGCVAAAGLGGVKRALTDKTNILAPKTGVRSSKGLGHRRENALPGTNTISISGAVRQKASEAVRKDLASKQPVAVRPWR